MAESNLKIISNLKVTPNLNDGFFKPEDKVDDNIQYINKESKHTPKVHKQLAASIEKLLSKPLF